MGRRIGGLPYARRHKEHFGPVVELLGTAAWSARNPTYHSAIINAAGEGAAMIIRLPSNALNHGRLRIYFLDYAITAPSIHNFALSITNYNCYDDPAGPTATRQVTFDPATLMACFEMTMDALVGVGNVLPGDVVLIQVDYAAAGGGGIASNFEVLGAVILEA